MFEDQLPPAYRDPTSFVARFYAERGMPAYTALATERPGMSNSKKVGLLVAAVLVAAAGAGVWSMRDFLRDVGSGNFHVG